MSLWSRRAAGAAVLFAVAVLAASCGASDPAAPPGPPVTGTVAPVTSVTVSPPVDVDIGRTGIGGGFGAVTVTVRRADGTEQRWCLLLADTPGQRERGLMEVTDPTLGGYDGMLFRFPADTSGAFWMRNTRLPLSIAFVAADGTVVRTTDMVPCPDSTPDAACPTYAPGAPYRYAVEVPSGRLAALGIDGGSRVVVGEANCPPTREVDLTIMGPGHP